MSSVSLQHRIEFLAFRVLVAVVSRLPEWVVSALGWCLGRFAGSVIRIRRTVVDRNLERAFPDETRAWRRRIARGAYVYYGREFLQLMRISRVSLDWLADRVEIEGLELIMDPVREGRGVVILTAHLGNWELAAAGPTARGLDLAAVAKRQANPLFDEHIRRLRAHLGITQVYQEVATRGVLQWLRRPGAVAFVADQNAGRAGIFVDFFGVPASTARGPVVFAGRTGADVVLGTMKRLSGIRPRYRLRMTPVRSVGATDPEEEARSLLRDYMRQLEGAIRREPEQYFWFHKRWKTRPPDETGNAEHPNARADAVRATGSTASRENGS